VATTKDLESEIHFLDEQLIYAQKHNETLREELTNLQEDRSRYSSQHKLRGKLLY
jgi:hypothetical protein